MKMFVKKFFGFSPEKLPIITFSQPGSRDTLLRAASPGDRLVYVAVSDDNATEADQGRILGMAEIGRYSVKSADVISDMSIFPIKYFDKNGQFLWPEGIPIVRAWRFTSPPHRLEIFKRETIDSQATRQNAVPLKPEEQDAILGLAYEEVDLPETLALRKAQDLNQALSSNISNDWKWEVARMTKTILSTVKVANGQTVEKTVKIKNTFFNESDLQVFLRQCLVRQNYLCAITGRKLVLEGSGDDWLRPSADRIDSYGHYTPENIQIVSKAANMAKGAIEPEEVAAYFAAIQFSED